jgi:uroporphyrinogen-III synthase
MKKMLNEGLVLNVLITRPKQKALALAKSLAINNIACADQPLFDYQPLADHQTSKSLLTNNNIIIFVSVSAVEFAHKIFSATNWQYQKIIAVGKATKEALQQLGIKVVLCPEQENSEGLLGLPILNKNFSGDKITIVRGASGREHLAEELTKQGATVTYLESYQCVWRTFTEDMAKQWFQQQINCILVTSNAILEKLIQLMYLQKKQSHNQELIAYWRDQCLWVVASQRIANAAKQFGLTHVIISNGASEDAIISTLQQLKTNKPRYNI